MVFIVTVMVRAPAPARTKFLDLRSEPSAWNTYVICVVCMCYVCVIYVLHMCVLYVCRICIYITYITHTRVLDTSAASPVSCVLHVRYMFVTCLLHVCYMCITYVLHAHVTCVLDTSAASPVRFTSMSRVSSCVLPRHRQDIHTHTHTHTHTNTHTHTHTHTHKNTQVHIPPRLTMSTCESRRRVCASTCVCVRV
jgi:hypothetical protein